MRLSDGVVIFVDAIDGVSGFSKSWHTIIFYANFITK